MPNYKIHIGDCSDILPTLTGSLYSGCLCDPPYGINFAGAEWDSGVPSKVMWKQVLDLLSPGSHLIAYGGTRTYHRLACNIEDAGFQIRDSILTVRSPSERINKLLSSLNEQQIEDLLSIFGESGLMAWMYGTGMPKSTNISKLMDRMNGASRKIVGTYKPPGMTKEWGLKKASDKRTVNIFASSRNNLDITMPGSPEGIIWDGYGTALKPVWEPVIVAMKPIEKSYIENAKKHGVAGLNIDASRLELMAEETAHENEYIKGKSGRWPTNIILSHDENCGEECVPWCPVPSFKNALGNKKKDGITRFVYCQKPEKKERNAGLNEGELNEHPTLKPIWINKVLANLIIPPETGKERRLLVPFCGSGSEMIGALQAGWDFVEGIEKEKAFAEIAGKRILHEQKGIAL